MAITYIMDDLTVLGGDLVLGNTGPSPASGTPVKGTATLQPAGNTTAGELILQAKTGAGTLRSTTLKNSTSSAADQTYTLPVNYPAVSGYVLASTTGGVLSWTAAGGGSGTVGGTGTDKHLTRWATGGADIEDTAWDATGDVLKYDDSTQKVIIDPVPGTITIQQPDGGSTYLLLGGEYSDTQARLELTNTAIQWGPGGGTARDVTLGRSSANNLTLGGGDTFNLDHLFVDNAGDIKLSNGGTIDTATGVANTFSLRGYATTGATYMALLTITNGAFAPLLDFPTGATWNGNYIYHAGGTDVPITDGGTGASTAAGALLNIAGWTYSYVTSAPFTTSSTTLVDITGLSFAAAANKTYEIQALMYVGTSAVSSGVKYGINFSAAGAAVFAECNGTSTTNAASVCTLNTINGASANTYLSSSSISGYVRIHGFVTTGANTGNITVRGLKVTSGTLTVNVGSYLRVRELTT